MYVEDAIVCNTASVCLYNGLFIILIKHPIINTTIMAAVGWDQPPSTGSSRIAREKWIYCTSNKDIRTDAEKL